MATVITREDGTVIISEDGQVIIREGAESPEVLTIRVRILLAIGTRLLTILTTNSFETDIGSHVFVWRDLDKEPLQASEVPSVLYNDISDEPLPEMSVFGADAHTLHIEIKAASAGATVESTLRNIIADLEIAINTDLTWGGYAIDSYLGTNEAAVEQIENKIGVITVPMTVIYRTAAGNPYANA
jgi:hypothetical protein